VVRGYVAPGPTLGRVTYVDDPTLEGEEIPSEEGDDLSDDLAEFAPVVLDPADQQFVDRLVDRVWEFTVLFSGVEMFPYQAALGRRIIESVISGDGATITGELSRQSGKTEVVANVAASLMILLPRLAEMFPEFEPLQKFARGVMIGCFAPVEQQVETLFGRVVDRLTSDRALEMLEDPDIDDQVKPGSRRVRLKKCGSFCAMQTANPRAKIESKSYHVIFVDESQSVDEYVLNKSITPMGAFYLASMIMTGTPDVVKGVFYKTIQHNKRMELRRGGKKNHFRFDWKYCARFNRNYAAYIRGEAMRIGEDSDEFRLNYKLEWLLERGMLITESRLDELGDTTMTIVPAYWRSPLIGGIDFARKMDSTVVTVIWVDWDRPDELGLYDHRVLNWLEMHGEEWEEQYFRICDFLANYSVVALGVDAQGIGDVAADRLKRLLPNIQVEPLSSQINEQSLRWKHLQALLQRGLMSWPAHPKARRTKTWKRFRQQMIDVEKKYQGAHLLVEAPNEAGVHDDYVDSLACGAIMSKALMVPEVEIQTTPWASTPRVNRQARAPRRQRAGAGRR
jgi:Terminase RNaseH-like domain